MAVAQSEFASFAHLAREAYNIKLGPRNAMFLVFTHLRAFTHAHPKVTFCKVERPVPDVAQSCDARATLSSTAPPPARLGRRKRSSSLARRGRPRSTHCEVQVRRCEHDEIACVAPSEALLWTRGWHPMLIMLLGARKAALPAQIQKGEPAHSRPWARTGPLMRPHRAAANPAPDTRM